MAVAGRVAIVPEGDYDITASYKRLSMVRYEGNSYVAKENNTGVPPTNEAIWMLSTEGAGIATAERAGIVKPDGKTITIDEDGTVHGTSLDFVGTAAEIKAAITAGTVTAGMTAFIKDGEIDGEGLLVEVAEGSGMSMIGKVENGEFVPYATMGEQKLGVPLFVFETNE